MNKGEVVKLIEKAHQEAHMCNSSQEVHDWIDWFDKELSISCIPFYYRRKKE